MTLQLHVILWETPSTAGIFTHAWTVVKFVTIWLHREGDFQPINEQRKKNSFSITLLYLQRHAGVCPVSPVLSSFNFPVLSESITLQHLLSTVPSLTLTSCLPCGQKNCPGRWIDSVLDTYWRKSLPICFLVGIYSTVIILMLWLLTRLIGCTDSEATCLSNLLFIIAML